jgi:hypothetical protein
LGRVNGSDRGQFYFGKIFDEFCQKSSVEYFRLLPLWFSGFNNSFIFMEIK